MKLMLIAMSILAVFMSTKVFVPAQTQYATAYTQTQTRVAVDAEPVAVRDWEGQVYDHIVAEGFPNPRLMLAIAKAESGLRLDALGDTTITDRTWGPSVSIFQIRTLKGETGKGTCRDIKELQKYDLKFIVHCAYIISGNGTNYKPWSAYLNGSYKKYL